MFFVIIAALGLGQIVRANESAVSSVVGYYAVGVNVALPLLVLSVAPAKAVTRRLIFLALGLILLIALNELSKLGLDLTAPKQG